MAIDVKRQSPSGDPDPLEIKSDAGNEPQTPETTKESGRQNTECSKNHTLRRKGRHAIRFLECELGVKAVNTLPPRIRCGHLRSAIRSCFSSNLELWQELSIKTSQKLEKSFCPACREGPGLIEFNKWKEERFRETDVDEDHISLFAAQLGRNVDQGWNRGLYPYIPNGHSCLEASRCEGGTWNEGSFSSELRPIPVVSSGKPRVVTLHSEFNTSVLYPLHKALYDSLKRKGWLLVGSPTSEKVSSLNGGGAYISVDYSSATDNIKVAYTKAAIEVLIERSVGLTDDQVRCLRAVAQPSIDGMLFTRGQPMGSMISFPLLCLINKTVVDLSENDLMLGKEISFKEWTSHRCLINGDDLLYRDHVSAPGKLFSGICLHGNKVGLITNEDKTRADAERGEINSTVFRNGVEEKKSNVSALFMGSEVLDVIGFANQSSRTMKGFRSLVWRGRELLLKQETKLQSILPFDRYMAIAKWRSLRPYLLRVVRKETRTPNLFPVVTRPAGYDLTREEEFHAITLEVSRLRREGRSKSSQKETVGTKEMRFASVRKSLKASTPADDKLLSVLASAWKDKAYESLRSETPLVMSDLMTTHCGDHIYSSPIDRITCMLKGFKKEKVAVGLPTVVPVEEFILLD